MRFVYTQIVNRLTSGRMCLVYDQAKAEEEEVDHTPWGELEPSDEESSEEEEEEESDEEKPDETGFFTPADRYLTCELWSTLKSGISQKIGPIKLNAGFGFYSYTCIDTETVT